MDVFAAINDPARPLSIPPEQWAKQDGTMRRGSIDPAPIAVEIDPLSKIDNAIDGMIANIKLCSEGLDEIDVSGFNSGEKAAIDSIRDILDNAIAPYVAEAAEAIGKLEID